MTDLRLPSLTHCVVSHAMQACSIMQDACSTLCSLLSAGRKYSFQGLLLHHLVRESCLPLIDAAAHMCRLSGKRHSATPACCSFGVYLMLCQAGTAVPLATAPYSGQAWFLKGASTCGSLARSAAPVASFIPSKFQAPCNAGIIRHSSSKRFHRRAACCIPYALLVLHTRALHRWNPIV